MAIMAIMAIITMVMLIGHFGETWSIPPFRLLLSLVQPACNWQSAWELKAVFGAYSNELIMSCTLKQVTHLRLFHFISHMSAFLGVFCSKGHT